MQQLRLPVPEEDDERFWERGDLRRGPGVWCKNWEWSRQVPNIPLSSHTVFTLGLERGRRVDGGERSCYLTLGMKVEENTWI